MYHRMSSEISIHTPLPETGRFRIAVWARIIGDSEQTMSKRLKRLGIPVHGETWKTAVVDAQEYWKHLPVLTVTDE